MDKIYIYPNYIPILNNLIISEFMSHSWWLKQQSEYILYYVSQYPIPIYPHPSSTDNTLDLHFVFGGYVYTYMGVQHFVRYITLNPYQSFPLAHHKVLPVALHGDND